MSPDPVQNRFEAREYGRVAFDERPAEERRQRQ